MILFYFAVSLTDPSGIQFPFIATVRMANPPDREGELDAIIRIFETIRESSDFRTSDRPELYESELVLTISHNPPGQSGCP
jgi:hypothetical protein